MAWQAVFTDNFNRAGGDLGADWQVITTGQGLSIVSNQAKAAAGTSPYGNFQSSNSYNNDQYAQALLAVKGGYPAFLGLRMTWVAPNTSRYVWSIDSGFYCFVQKVDGSGTVTNIGSSFNITDANGVTVRAEVVGTTIEVFRAGVSQTTRSDSTYASGKPGLLVTRTEGIWDDFEGGHAVAAAGGGRKRIRRMISAKEAAMMAVVGALVKNPSVSRRELFSLRD